MASELLANAIAASPADAMVALRASKEADVVTLEAINRVTDWVSLGDRWDTDDPLRTGGRGLLVVAALVDDIEAEHDVTDLCTVVRVRRNVSTEGHEEGGRADMSDLRPWLRI